MEIPDSIEEFLPHYAQVLLESHGALTWGADLLSAYHKMESVEFYAELMHKTMALGGVREIAPEKLEVLYEMRKNMSLTGKHPVIDK